LYGYLCCDVCKEFRKPFDEAFAERMSHDHDMESCPGSLGNESIEQIQKDIDLTFRSEMSDHIHEFIDKDEFLMNATIWIDLEVISKLRVDSEERISSIHFRNQCLKSQEIIISFRDVSFDSVGFQPFKIGSIGEFCIKEFEIVNRL